MKVRSDKPVALVSVTVKLYINTFRRRVLLSKTPVDITASRTTVTFITLPPVVETASPFREP